MGKYLNKLIAPVIVVICIVAYYLIIGTILIKINIPTIFKIVGLIVSVVITIILGIAFVERIKEIRSGEEDDLGKY
jgi:membrane protein implicated in regulation of membrane protease activity